MKGQGQLLVTEESARLARWLRLMGFDTAQQAVQPLPALYQRAVGERRVIVTRNRRVRAGRLIRVIQLTSQALEEQLRQVVRDAPLSVDREQSFTRCDVCNTLVEPIERTRVKDRVPPYVFQTQQTFHTCPSCQRIFWAATHYDRIRTVLEAIHAEVRR